MMVMIALGTKFFLLWFLFSHNIVYNVRVASFLKTSSEVRIYLLIGAIS